jgi:hypothetical protein
MYTLIPVLASAALIWFSGEKVLVVESEEAIIETKSATTTRSIDITTRLLSSNVAVGIGLISYSLYLFHQPIYVLARARYIDTTADMDVCTILVLVATVLAIVSYFVIEQPFRHKAQVSTKSIFSLFFIFEIALMIFGLNCGYLHINVALVPEVYVCVCV